MLMRWLKSFAQKKEREVIGHQNKFFSVMEAFGTSSDGNDTKIKESGK